MEWRDSFAGNVKRTVTIAAFSVGSLYVLYSLLEFLRKGTSKISPEQTTVRRRRSDNVQQELKEAPWLSTGVVYLSDEHKCPNIVSIPPRSVDTSSESRIKTGIDSNRSTTTEEPVLSLESSAPQKLDEQTDQLSDLIESLKYNGARNLNEDEVDCIGFLLTTNIESLLCETLSILGNCSAFYGNQEKFREQGVIFQVKKLIRHESDVIKIQALTALANLCVNEENQSEFVDEIPYFLELAFREGCSMLSIVALCALTNLTVKFGSYPEILQHANLLASKAVCAGRDESLQAIKLLVNISCEEEGSEYLVRADLRNDFFDLIRAEAAISQRCLTILANIIPKVPDGSSLEDIILGLKTEMLNMWRSSTCLEEAQKDQLRRALKALSIRGWGRLSESTMNLVNEGT